MVKWVAWGAFALACFVAAFWPAHASAAPRCGIASWYNYTGRPTANGERFPTGEATAAHKTLPFGAHVLVTDMVTGRSVVVRINDRGPFVRGRIIDLSPAARRVLGGAGLWKVCLN